MVAVAGDPVHRRVFYFGAAAGGVFKTEDAGITWRPISDGFFRTASVGALAVAPSDPEVIYAGMGEACIRGNVTYGDGVYRSTDGGRTWQNVGLTDTRHISRVRIDPRDPNRVYVAALGHAFGPSLERGVFRTTDGGRTWEHVLRRDDQTGASDLMIDPENPRILYAGLWQAVRTPWSLVSGGPGSGLFRSTDGGDTWTELTDRPGLPRDVKGRIGVAVSAARPERIWAFVEAREGGLFRSDDRGETFVRVSQDPELSQRAWYYGHVFADPKDAETVWVLNVNLLRSTDGGRTFSPVAVPHGDHHDLWIDPADPERMIEGSDGGAVVTLDGGLSWSSVLNQPTAQFYHVAADTRFPYRLYGAQQDNTTLSVPSRTDSGAILVGDCHPVGGGESGYVAVRPDRPEIVYAGNYGLLTRYDDHAKTAENILPWPENVMGAPAKDLRYRFQWTFPILLSPHDPQTLYCAAQVVFRSRDEGQSWEEISPDLTAHRPKTLESSGGPITQDNTSVEYYGTVFALSESPVRKGLLWAGSDDGLVHVSEDAGASWCDVTPPELKPDTLVSVLEPSPHDAASCYLAASRLKMDDYAPYLYRTRDRGKSWERIGEGLPQNETTRVVREDPARQGLLYVGTEGGVHVSFDAGEHFVPLSLNLPALPVHDLLLVGKDLAAATHGRGFWILDDLTPVRTYHPDEIMRPAFVVTAEETVLPRGGRTPRPPKEPGRIYRPAGAATVTGWAETSEEGGLSVRLLDAGENPPSGLVVHYHLSAETVGGEGEGEETRAIRLLFLDETGNVIRSFSSEEPEKEKLESQGLEVPLRLRPKRGWNRFVWDVRYPPAEGMKDLVLWAGTLQGPIAPPGRYRIQVARGDKVLAETSFRLVKDPRLTASDAELAEQFDLLLAIRDEITRVHRTVRSVRRLRAELEPWQERAQAAGETALAEEVGRLAKALGDGEELLVEPRIRALEDALNYAIRTNNKLAALALAVASAPARPTSQARAVFAELKGRVDRAVENVDRVRNVELPALASRLRESGLPLFDTGEENALLLPRPTEATAQAKRQGAE